MKKMLGLVALTATMLLASCTTVMPLTATSNALGSKVGEAKVNMLFGLPLTFNADLGVQKAAKEAGISKISTVDVKAKTIVGVWTTVSTVVTGD